MDSLDRPVPAPRTAPRHHHHHGHQHHRKPSRQSAAAAAAAAGRERHSDEDLSSSENDCTEMSTAQIGDRSRGSQRSAAVPSAAAAAEALNNRKRWHQQQQQQSNARDPLYIPSGGQQSAGTPHRLYSYVSGSDGDEDHPSSVSRLPTRPPGIVQCRSTAAGADDALSSCSSLSSVHSSSASDDVDHGGRPVVGRDGRRSNDRLTDTLDSSGIGENVYSRIREAGFMPVLPPPPPLEAPAVPLRMTVARPAVGSQTLGRRPVQPPYHTSAFNDSDSDTPRFLMHTASGNVFIPSGNEYNPTPPTSIPTFPRTVPRTVSLQRTDRGALDQPNRISFAENCFSPPPPPPQWPQTGPPPQQWSQGGPPPPQWSQSGRGVNGDPLSRTDGLSADDHAASRPNAVVPPSVVRPSTQLDIRNYSRFSSTFNDSPYRDKKRNVCERWLTWKCGSMLLLGLAAILVVLIVYLLIVRFYNLSWRLESDPVLADHHSVNGSSPSVSVILTRYQLGQTLEDTVPPYNFMRAQFYLDRSSPVKYDVIVPLGAVVGVYGRRNVQPTHTRFDFFQAIDGSKVIYSRSKRSLANQPPLSVIDSTFVQQMEPGLWFVFVYNDGDQPQKLAFKATQQDPFTRAACAGGCSYHGDCVNAVCNCFPGYSGPTCGDSMCPAVCSGNGIYEAGVCKCQHGWSGVECQLPAGRCAGVDCSLHGRCVDGECVCAAGFTGADCSVELCLVDCGVHGRCENQRCVCDVGWSGTLCSQRECDPRCAAGSHGHCENGTCLCQPGWNGRHCTLDGCPGSCGRNGNCRMFLTAWSCSCHDGWKGNACEIALETLCSNNVDEDGDGLTDCQDPDCCIDIACRESIHCRTAPDPMEILLRKQPPSPGASFYDRMRFLVEDDSVQSYATLSSFNQTQVSVIRGRVITKDGSSLVGVRVSVVTQPLYGFTLTREQGLFDILANGGGSVTLQFQRQPFQSRRVTVIVPWNRIMVMDTVTLMLDGDEEEQRGAGLQCSDNVKHNRYSLKPIVLSQWHHSQLSGCESAPSAAVPETQVLRERLSVSGTGLQLIHDSSDAPGYMSSLLIGLTPESIPPLLMTVRLRVVVEGVVFEKDFEADADLKYRFTWDRRNAYNQKVYGIVSATVAVGYLYEGCKTPFWEVQMAKVAGNDLMSSEIAGWNFDVHHIYSVQDGVVYKGDGSNIYLKMSPQPHHLVLVLGDVAGRRRRVDCNGCDGATDGNLLLSPIALASGRDGALYVGDYNYIRRLSPGRDNVASILQLSMPDVQYKYYMVVSPLDGRLYITDQQNLRIIRVKTMGAVRDLAHNYEVVAGSGQQCVPGDVEQCGDGGLATDARLFYPKGIAISKDGIVYFSDGANIRAINEAGVIRTIIGSQGSPRHWTPFPCNHAANLSEVTLRWPTALTINPLDDTLHILDDGLILKVTKDNSVIVIAGRSPYCSFINTSNINSSSAAADGDDIVDKSAVKTSLEHPQNFAFSPDGDLYVVESNALNVRRVRVIDSSGRIRHYYGTQCQCQHVGTECQCDTSTLAIPSAVALTPDGVVHIADTGQARVHSAATAEPSLDRQGQLDVVDGPSQQVYVFNRYGQHLATRDLVTGVQLYNFTYNVHSYFGRLLKIIDTSGHATTVRRDYKLLARDISSVAGERCRLSIDTMGQLQSFTSSNNITARFTYTGNTGLMESRDDERGLRLYEYDEAGHLTRVTLPTGWHVSIVDTGVTDRRACVSVMGEVSSVAMTTSHADTTLTQNELRTASSHKHEDGTFSVKLPSQAFVGYEFNDRLPSAEYQLGMRRVIQLPGNLSHTAEWWYQLRPSPGAPSSRSAAPSSEKVARRLKVNGEPVLTLEFDRTENIEMVYSGSHDRLLTIRYDLSGRPIHFMPTGPLEGLNVTYDSLGRVTSWSRGDVGVANVYDDKTDLLVERKLANRMLHRYIYKNGNKPTDVILPSGRQYQLHYDTETGGLSAVTTPTLQRHQFFQISSLGVHRVIYQPPNSLAGAAFVRNFDASGRLIQTLFPSGRRRITYYYDRDGGTRDLIFHDWTDIVFTRHESTGLLSSTRLLDRSAANFSVLVEFSSVESSALITSQTVKFGGFVSDVGSGSETSSAGLLNASFRYTYGQSNLALVALDATIGGRVLRTLNFNYSTETGRLTRVQSFLFEFPRAHREVIRDSNVEVVRDFDSRGRPTDVWFRFSNYVVFSLEVKHDALGRIHQWRRKVGSSDLRAYERVYNVDGDVTEVHVSGQPTWRYEFDADGNIIKASLHGNARIFAMDQRTGRIDSAGEQSYVHDADGRVAQRDSETFEYSAFGSLLRAFETDRHDVTFHYDSFRRLVVKRDVMSGDVIQFFYADPVNTHRITHIVDSVGASAAAGATRWRVSEMFYDTRGKLFAMRRDTAVFYIALDPTDSPIVVLNEVGSVVKQIDYDPLGAQIGDSAPDFMLPLGFRCGIVDRSSKLVVFVDGRAYDPSVGRWMVPNYDQLVTSIDQLAAYPELTNLYRMVVWKQPGSSTSFVTDMSDWLSELGYNMRQLLPNIRQHSHGVPYGIQAIVPQSISTMSLLDCAFKQAEMNFGRLTSVRRSKVVSPPVSEWPTVGQSVAPLHGIFGHGVIISGRQASVYVLEPAADSELAVLATTLLNGSESIDLPFTVHGRDVHHFIHEQLDRSTRDLQLLGLRTDLSATVAGINMTIHQHRRTSDSEEYVEVRLHSDQTWVMVRYGVTALSERDRILKRAAHRAAEAAWEVERERAQTRKRGVNAWTKREIEDLLSRGHIDGFQAVYIRSIAEFPELADDPHNVRFVRTN